MKYPSDTIIRKDVLDTLKWWQEEYPEIPHLAEIVADMEHLPPVQEQPDVPDTWCDEWCTDCKEYDHERHCCPRFNHVIRTTLQEVQEERKKGKWEVHNILDYKQRPSGRKILRCPFCGYLTDDFKSRVDYYHKLTHFCPNCGAEMTGGEQDDEIFR